MNHLIRTFDENGAFLYQESFNTSDEAYKAYIGIIDNLNKTLPAGYQVTVARFNGGQIMTMETVNGTK